MHYFFLTVTDVEKNLILYMYCPEARESFGGSKLLRKADIHIGYQINTLFRIRCRLGDVADHDRRQAALLEKRHVTMFGKIYFIYL